MSAAELCVIFNPAAGHGLAARRLESLRRVLGDRADFLPTAGPGHAEELAGAAARAGTPLVGAFGGDGTLHEVANGLLGADRPGTALAVFPSGSANDYAHSLGLPPAWWVRPDFPVGLRAVDVGLVQAGAAPGRQRFFLNVLGLAFTGAVNLESRRIRRLRGLARYGLALARALWLHYTHPLMTVTLDGTPRTVPTLTLSVAIGQREGNFLLNPQAQIDDGLFDYLHAGPVSRWELFRHLPALIWGGLPTDHPRLWVGRCREVRLTSEAPLTVHVDGEFFCSPEDNVRDLEVHILPGKLRVQARVEPK